jgi:Tfp pilus assembly protein FimV
MTGRKASPLRVLAPVALVAFGLALFLIVSSSPVVTPDRPAPSDRAAAKPEASPAPARERRERRRRARRKEDRLPRSIYTVKPGDTLDGISQKTGLSTERLQELNPKLDPRALEPGQKIRLRE